MSSGISEEASGLEIAVIGLAGRFPGAGDVRQFWENLRLGVESIATFSEETLAAAGVDARTRANPSFVPRGGALDGVELFDADFFGMHPREAERLDPQQRIFLECSWHALEDAGYDPARYAGPIGVYAGAAMSAYLLGHLYDGQNVLGSEDGFQLMLGNDKDFLASRVSYKLDLRGPSCVVQSACSTSLVAIHMACQSLLSGESDMALAGGVSIHLPQDAGYTFQEGAIVSPDGRCRAYDAAAAGTVLGNGVGIVVLRRLADAIADGDAIRAVIRGSAVNNDGARKVSFTAPRADGQAATIRAAQVAAGVDAGSITYVEGHGTGTSMGDPIEVAALTQAFRETTQEKQFCALGSVKTNIGHLNTAAGVAGFIKAVLALENREIPPTLHFQTPNPKMNLAETPFFVNATPLRWDPGPTPRRAAVSSFGIGGTNAHVVLEEAPVPARERSEGAPQLLALSARTPQALETMTDDLARHLAAHPEIDLPAVAFTLREGRRLFPNRRAVVASDARAAAAALEARGAGVVRTGHVEGDVRAPIFLFPGQGSQYIRMGEGLYRAHAAYRAAFDECAETLRPELDFDLRGLLFPAAGDEARAEGRLHDTATTQPALFAVEYALVRLWASLGITPRAMIGHSLGEYVAACVAGVFSLEDALRLVAARARLMSTLPRGGMLAVPLPEQEIAPLVEGKLSLAAVNGPSSCVVSGELDEIAALEASLAGRGIAARRLRVSHAFHSRMMDPILPEFDRRLRDVALHAPRIPYVSNVTGTWITPERAMDRAYWTEHVRRPVRMWSGLQRLVEAGAATLIEVGPGRTLGSFARQLPGTPPLLVSSLRTAPEAKKDDAVLLDAIGQLFVAGHPVECEKLPGSARRRVSLPGYRFDRRRYWVERRTPSASASRGSEPDAAPTLYARPEIAASYAAPRDDRERLMAEVWMEAFGIDRIGIHDDFFALGGQSLLASALVTKLSDRLGVSVPVRALFEAPSIAALAEVVARGGTSVPSRGMALADDVVLDEDVRPRALRDVSQPPRHVFLTGATGFLGAFLLHELLERTPAIVTCLVRAKTETQAGARLRDNLSHYGLWREAHAGRIRPIQGDLEQPRLGLGEREYASLAESADAIFHAGARVNFTYPYEALRAANVLAVREIFRLACSRAAIPVHLLSTAAIFSAPEYERTPVVAEDDPLEHGEALRMGYQRSKWVAEKIAGLARARGIPVAVYRPATVSGHSATGASNLSDFVLSTMLGCAQRGLAPELDTNVHMAPADFVARAIVALSLLPGSLGRCFHLTPPSPIRLREMMSLVDSLGYPMEVVPYAEWRRTMIDHVRANPGNAIAPFLPLFLEEPALECLRFDSRNVSDALRGTGVACPPVERGLLGTYFAYYERAGLLGARGGRS